MMLTCRLVSLNFNTNCAVMDCFHMPSFLGFPPKCHLVIKSLNDQYYLVFMCVYLCVCMCVFAMCGCPYSTK